MKLSSRIAVVVVATAALASQPAQALQIDAAKIHKLATRHYDLWIEGTPEETEQVGFVLEQAWNAFDAYFKVHPDPEKRLAVKLYATEQEFLDSIWSDGAIVPAQCRPAYWSDMSGAMYAYGPPSSYTTRKCVLFAAMLQFNALAKSKNRDLPREWYEAGLAQAFARHTWDGKKLVLMARPLVEPLDFPLRALKLIEDDPAGLPQLIDAELPEPIACWSAIGLCIAAGHGRYKTAFDKYVLGTTGSKLPGRDFLKTLGSPTAVARDLHAWLLDEQTPFEMVSAEWEDRGGRTLVGVAEVGKRALCILKSAEPDVIECTLGELPKLRARAGLVTGYYGPGDMVLISVVAPSVVIDVWMDFKLVHTASIEIPGDHVKPRALKLTRKGPEAQLEIDGIPIAPRELPQGRNGLFVESVRAEFRDVRWH